MKKLVNFIAGLLLTVTLAALMLSGYFYTKYVKGEDSKCEAVCTCPSICK